MKRAIIIVVLILLIVLAIDFVKFQNAVRVIKNDIPIKGFDTPIVLPSYRPFLWGRPVSGLTYRSMGNDEIEKPLYVHFRIGEHQAVTVWTNGENWFDYTVPVKDDEDNRNEWYKQEYNSITGYVKILSHQEYYDKDNKISKAKILYYFETDTQKIYFAVQNMTLRRGGCDGGYWYGTVGTPY
jgi:hypothetical protein